MLINIAYVTLLPPEELMNSGAVAVVRAIVIGGGEGRLGADQYRICHPALTRGTDELRDSGCGTYYSHWGRGGRVGC